MQPRLADDADRLQPQWRHEDSHGDGRRSQGKSGSQRKTGSERTARSQGKTGSERTARSERKAENKRSRSQEEPRSGGSVLQAASGRRSGNQPQTRRRSCRQEKVRRR